MRIVCVDDEELLVERTAALCRKLPYAEDVFAFSYAEDAVRWFTENTADLALLDIDMPDMNGLQLAANIKKSSPYTRVIFLTGYAEYAIDAYAMHAEGYLLKPIGYDSLREEIEYIFPDVRGERKEPEGKVSPHIEARTFGYFNLLVDGRPVRFSRSKAKELLAFLIDQNGNFVSRKDIFYALWEDSNYERSKQKYLDTVIRSLRDTLQEYQISDILETEKGAMRVVPDKLVCDLYRFLKGDIDAVNSYRGEYMNSYSWADMTEGYLSRKISGKE